MYFGDLLSQCGAFLMLARQSLSLNTRVQKALESIEECMYKTDSSSYGRMRDNLHFLYVCAHEADYPIAASYLYGWYVHYARLLLDSWMYS